MPSTIAAFDRMGEENAFAVLARDTELGRQGRDIINLGIGQPDFATPPNVVEAAVRALRDGHHGYTPATGILPLREALAAKYGLEPERLIFGCGSDEVFSLLSQVYLQPGDNAVQTEFGFLAYRIAVRAAQAQVEVERAGDQPGDLSTRPIFGSKEEDADVVIRDQTSRTS